LVVYWRKKLGELHSQPRWWCVDSVREGYSA